MLPPNVTFRYPGARQRQFVVTFSPTLDIGDKHITTVALRKSHSCSTAAFLQDGAFGFDRRTARDAICTVLRAAWGRMIAQRGLSTYDMANGIVCAYFTEGILGPSANVRFKGVHGKPTYRQLVGYRSRPQKDHELAASRRYWHFGFDCRPFVHPQFGYSLRTHVLFSNDGNTIWKSKDNIQRARRIQCRDWWNEEWRDRLLAAVAWLCDGGDSIKLELAEGTVVAVQKDSMGFRSPVSYIDPKGGKGLVLYDPDEDTEDEPFEDEPGT